MASNSEDELIDLDKVLPLKKDYNWLLESNSNNADFYGSFNELNFSNPLIKNVIEAIYLNGKSKQMLHNLMNLNHRMTVSCDSYGYLCNNSFSSTTYRDNVSKRHSLSFVTQKLVEDSVQSESESLTDSLDSIDSLKDTELESEIKSNQIKTSHDRTGPSYILKESGKLPVTKTTPSTTDNVLSRTYDKDDLEILKQTQLSQSVFVPHITGSNIDHYSQIQCQRKSSGGVVKATTCAKPPTQTSLRRRLFPTTDGKRTEESKLFIRPRPTSMYQIDKTRINSQSISHDRSSVKISQSKKSNINTKLLWKVNQSIFDSEVVTSLSSVRNGRKKEAILKPPPPLVKRFIK